MYAGKPVTVAPVAPVVAYVIFVIGVLIQLVWASVPTAENQGYCIGRSDRNR